MLHRRRQRLQLLAEQEAAGRSFWTTDFNDAVRTRIKYAFDDSMDLDRDAPEIARGVILRDEGLPYLFDVRYRPYVDLTVYLSKCDHEMVPTVIEAIHLGVVNATYAPYDAGMSFSETIRTILREHRISYDFIAGEMVSLASLEMHEAVVEPTLRLLASAGKFTNVEVAYQAALQEITDGNAADAITDAGTALQETLAQLGCEGNALGSLIKSAKKKKLLAAHDGPMLDAFDRVANWVAADRSESGDSHKIANPSLPDAWLIVHVVGALVLRLAEDSERE